MKKSVMIMLFLAGLTEMGAIQAMSDITAKQTKSAVCHGYYEPVENNKEALENGTLHVDSRYNNPGAISPSIANNQQFMQIKKTLKGYSSMKRTPYLIELMQLV